MKAGTPSTMDLMIRRLGQQARAARLHKIVERRCTFATSPWPSLMPDFASLVEHGQFDIAVKMRLEFGPGHLGKNLPSRIGIHCPWPVSAGKSAS